MAPCPSPRLTAGGIAFTVQVDKETRDCFISANALQQFSAVRNIDASDAQPMDVFCAFEASITAAAKKLAKSMPGEVIVAVGSHTLH